MCFWHEVKDGEVEEVAEETEPLRQPAQEWNFWDRIFDQTEEEPATETSNLGPVYPNGQPEVEDEKPKRTFPSDSNVYHFHPIAFVEHMKRIVAMEDIDLRSIIKWLTQFSATFGSYKEQKKSCYKASERILKNSGIISGGKLGSFSKEINDYGFKEPNNVIQTSVELNKKVIILQDGAKNAIKYIDQELEKGNPILVGVRHTFFEFIEEKKAEYVHSHSEWNYDISTDHFIVIIGRGYDKGQRFFRFYEVGTSYEDNGRHDDNKLFINDDLSITGSPKHKQNRIYTLTHVRGNKTNGDFN